MTSKLYAESAPRGFKAYQVEIPVAKVLNRIQEQGKQKVANIEAVAKADKERSRAWLESKLHADKVTLDNIKDNYRFSERNKARIAKAEQKELDNRVQSAQIEYNQNARRPPDKSLLEKLGPALAKAVPQIVGAVQAHQAGLDKAAGEAAQETMYKLDATSAELNDWRTTYAALRNDEVALEAHLNTIRGVATGKGHVITDDDIVRLLEDGTGAYTRVSNEVAATNGMGQLHQTMLQWYSEEGQFINDFDTYQQKVDGTVTASRNETFGEDYLWGMPAYIKYSQIAPQEKKIKDQLYKLFHARQDKRARKIEDQRQLGTWDVLFANTPNQVDLEKIYTDRIIANNGDRTAAHEEMAATWLLLARDGRMQDDDIEAIYTMLRRTSRNPKLGLPKASGGVENDITNKLKHIKNVALNYSHQILRRENQALELRGRQIEQQVAIKLAEEPSAATAKQIEKDLTEWSDWHMLPKSRQDSIKERLAEASILPQADTRKLEKKLKMPGLEALTKSQAKASTDILAREKTGGVPLAELESGGLYSDGAISHYQYLLETEMWKLYRDNLEYQNNPRESMMKLVQEADKIVQESKAATALFDTLKENKKSPGLWEFVRPDGTVDPLTHNEVKRNLRNKELVDNNRTDKLFFGTSRDRALIDTFAAAWTKSGGAVTQQEILGYATQMPYLVEVAKKHNMPLTELFRNQIKVLYPNITIPESVITTTEEINRAGAHIRSFMNGTSGVQTQTSDWLGSGKPYGYAKGVMPTSYIPGGDDYAGGVWKPLVDLISSGEGTYDSMFPSRRFPEILNMTIPEVVEFQKRNQIGRSAAIGRGQFLYPEGVAKLAGLTADARFSPSNQNKMIVALIERKRSGKQWLEGRISDEQFSEQLAREWGALKSASGYVLPNNTGKIGFNEIKNALQQVRDLMKQDNTFGTNIPSGDALPQGSFAPTPKSRGWFL